MTIEHAALTSSPGPQAAAQAALAQAFARFDHAIAQQRDALAARDTAALSQAIAEVDGASQSLNTIVRDTMRTLNRDQRRTVRDRVRAASLAMQVQQVALARLQGYTNRGLISGFGLQTNGYDRTGQTKGQYGMPARSAIRSAV